MTFTVGMKCKTRDGRDAMVICVDANHGGFPVVALVRNNDNSENVRTYSRQGNAEPYCELPYDLIPPKRSGTFWVNVYPEDAQHAHFTKTEADACAMSNRLACIEVHWEEGDGL